MGLATTMLAAAVVTATGFGQLQVGMTKPQAETALGSAIRFDPDTDQDCVIALPTDPALRGMSFMFEHGKLTRIDVDGNRSIKTAAGIGIGSSEVALRKAYGASMRVAAHPYESARSQRITMGDAQIGLVFETRGGRVSTFRGGRQPSISYDEGCS